jgi:hypothetical protein
LLKKQRQTRHKYRLTAQPPQVTDFIKLDMQASKIEKFEKEVHMTTELCVSCFSILADRQDSIDAIRTSKESHLNCESISISRPVSAYALFFRDTQAAIKGQNPNASFGEVSKIVASMWDVLSPEHKNVSIEFQSSNINQRKILSTIHKAMNEFWLVRWKSHKTHKTLRNVNLFAGNLFRSYLFEQEQTPTDCNAALSV